MHTALTNCESLSLSLSYSRSQLCLLLRQLAGASSGTAPSSCSVHMSASLYKVAFLLYLLFLSRAFCLHEVVELRISKLEGEAGIRFLHTDICRGHKAWSGHHAPTAVDIEDVLARTQNRTTFITCTKRGAAIINDHTVQVLFRNRRQRLLAQVPGDYEDNQDNHGEGRKLCTDRAPVPAQVPLYRGLRIVLTKNLDKEHHFVNGMGAVVEAVDLETASVLVRTDTGFLLTVYKYTDTEVPVDRVVYFPLRLGYEGTVYKHQGAELDHVTLWLDRPGCPGAAYVALSRVKYDSDYLLGGIVTVKDVVPAR